MQLEPLLPVLGMLGTVAGAALGWRRFGAQNRLDNASAAKLEEEKRSVEVARAKTMVEAMEVVLDARQQSLIAAEQRVADRDARIATLEETLAARNARIAELEARIAQHDQPQPPPGESP